MSSGDVDVELYLDSRNTKGYGTATQILKAKFGKIVGVSSGKAGLVLCGSGGGMWKCMWAPERNLARVRRETYGGWVVLLPGAGCPGVMAGCPGWSGRMSGHWIRGRIRRTPRGA